LKKKSLVYGVVNAIADILIVIINSCLMPLNTEMDRFKSLKLEKKTTKITHRLRK